MSIVYSDCGEFDLWWPAGAAFNRLFWLWCVDPWICYSNSIAWLLGTAILGYHHQDFTNYNIANHFWRTWTHVHVSSRSLYVVVAVVRPSVVCRLSVTFVHLTQAIEITSYERSFILVFWEEEWLVGGDPFYVKFWANQPRLERNRRFSTNNRS